MARIFIGSDGRTYTEDGSGIIRVVGDAGLGFLKPVEAVQYDALLNPGSSPAQGDRYIITDKDNLHANFGTIAGIGHNDIVEYNGSAFKVSYDVSSAATSEGGLVWVRSENDYRSYNGVEWISLMQRVWSSVGEFTRLDNSTFYSVDPSFLDVGAPIRYSDSQTGGWNYGVVTARYTNVHTGFATVGSIGNTINLAAAADPTPSHYNNAIIEIISGTGNGQIRRIIAYSGGPNNTATVDAAWVTIPDITSQYKIYYTYNLRGAPLDASHDTYMEFRDSSGLVELSFYIPGVFGTTLPNLIETLAKQFFRWQRGTAYLVGFDIRAVTPDTGPTQPNINVTIGGGPVSTSNGAAGIPVIAPSVWSGTLVDIQTTNYVINYNSSVEVSTDGSGSVQDAADLTIQFVIVLE